MKHLNEISARVDAYNAKHDKKLVRKASKTYSKSIGKPYYCLVEYSFGERTLVAVAMCNGTYLMVEEATATREYLDEFLETLK